MRVIVCALTLTGAIAAAQSVPEIPYNSNLPLRVPVDRAIGEVASVAVSVGGRAVYVLSRSSATSSGLGAGHLYEFDLTSGRFTAEIAADLYAWSFPHSVRIDREGNIWVVDSGSNMVVQFKSRQVSMVLGRRTPSMAEPLPWEPAQPTPPRVGQFGQPTDVAFDSQHNIYVADGHVNSRVSKFDKTGKWLLDLGLGRLKTPHAIVVDGSDKVYVGDTGNRKIHVFNTMGVFVKEYKIDLPISNKAAWTGEEPGASQVIDQNGAPWSMCIVNDALYVADAYPGRIYKLKASDGTVMGVLGKSGRALKEFGWIHGLACVSENELYAGELLNWRVQRLLLQPTAPAPPPLR